jgi:DmsE family decaheme c-type cytochrome
MDEGWLSHANKRKAGLLRCVVLPIVFVVLSTSPSLAYGVAGPQQPGDEYVGTEVCRACHEASFNKWKSTAMGKAFMDHPRTPLEAQGCESCHGPGRAHVEAGGDLAAIIRFDKKSDRSVEELNGQCLQCHEKGARLFWQGSTHESRGVACVNCHQVMQPNIPSLRFEEPLTGNRQFVKQTKMEVCFQCHPLRRAQVQRSAHMPFREGKVTCTDCHNPHGGPNPKMLLGNTVNETCYKCHAERRGPFLWEHPPVMENCLNCHEAHGSARPQLLKVSMPRLCQQCHDVNRHNATPQLATARFAFNRGCTNCHSQIHGSNHPSGVWYQR